MTLVLLIALTLLTLKVCFEYFLESANETHVRENRHHLPSVFRGVFSRETFDKANDYTLEKTRLNRFETVYSGVVLGLVLLLGIIPLFYGWFSAWVGFGVWGQALVFCLILVVLGLPGMPIDYYATFYLEEKFGFNKSSVRLWVIDRLKGLLLTLLIGVPLAALIFWIVTKFPGWWWLLGFAVFFVFQLVMMVLYPVLIVPLFNKLRPMEEGPLKDRLMALADRTGFKASTIQVIDGSKRSKHSNAYFTGFGRFRRIVLYDTLIEQLQEDEIEGVLAHEIGHYRKGHIPKMILISAASLLLGFFVIHMLVWSDWFVAHFGFRWSVSEYGELARFVPAFLLFVVLAGVVTFWISPLMNRLSRKHEYEADAFAADAVGSPDPLVRALRRLYEKNLTNLIPHPLYSRFYYSHPTLPEREKAMRTWQEKKREAAGDSSEDVAETAAE